MPFTSTLNYSLYPILLQSAWGRKGPQCVILMRHRRSNQAPTAQLYLKQLSTATAAGASWAARGEIFQCGNGDSWFQRPGVERWLPPRLTNRTPGNSRLFVGRRGTGTRAGKRKAGKMETSGKLQLIAWQNEKKTDRQTLRRTDYSEAERITVLTWS